MSVPQAIDVTNNRRIAIKVCRLQKHSHRGHHYDQDILRRRVQQEIALWKYVPQAIDLQQWYVTLGSSSAPAARSN